MKRMDWQPIVVAGGLLWGAPAEASCPAAQGQPLEISGDVQQGGLGGTFRRTLDPASGRFAEAIELGLIRTGSGFDGRLAWLRDVSGRSHHLNSDFARRLAASEAWLSARLGCGPLVPSRSARRVGTDRASGLDVWRIVPAGGAAIELWFDRRRGQIDRAILQYPENRIIHRYADWRRIMSGRTFPFTQRDEDPEDESETVYHVRRVARAGRARFDPPPPPNDSRIVGGPSTTIAFADDNRRRVYLPVYLNGKGPFAFELDNGGHFILTKETATALGLEAQGAFSSTGAGNQIRQSGYARVERLRVGNAELVGQVAKILALSHNERGAAPPRAGILGLEFFERFVVAIDHRGKTVTLRSFADSPKSHPGRPLPLLFDEDAPLVAGSYRGVTGPVMLDIGNAGPTIIEDYWADRHGQTERLVGGTAHGSARWSTGTVGLGPFAMAGETVAYLGRTERGSEYTRSVAAIIGEPLLSRFNAVYDYSRNTVWLDPLPALPPVSFEKRP
jgi:hypothetical protein